MKTTRRDALKLGAAATGVALAGGVPLATPVRGQATKIRIGELFSYARMAAFAEPYRNGWMLGLEEINAAGGVKGLPLEIISRDDGATTADAVRVAEELVSGEKVNFLFGTFLSNVGLAVADFANQKKVLFLAAEPLSDAVTLQGGNRYTFRVRPHTFGQTRMLVEEAKSTGRKKWAVVAPNYEYGQSAVASFKRLIGEAIPGATVVVEQFPALGKIDTGATVQALAAANPDGIFSALFGADLTKFVREGNDRGLFKDRTVLNLLAGEPEYLDPMKDDTPSGWIVTGYPWEQIKTPEHTKFVDAYRKRFNDYPRLGSLLGYTCIQTIRTAIDKAGGTDTEALIRTLRGLDVATPAGPITFRASDHQSTMGAWVGKLAQKDGKGMMVDWRYRDGKDYMHSAEDVAKLRPAS